MGRQRCQNQYLPPGGKIGRILVATSQDILARRGATLLVAAVAIFAVSQWVFVRDGQWTSSVVSFTVALVGVVVALGIAVCWILEGFIPQTRQPDRAGPLAG